MFAADMHCDTISKLYEEQKRGNPVNLYENNFQVDLNKLKRGQYLLQNFAVFTDIGTEKDPCRHARDQIALFQSEMRKNNARVRQVKNADEIEINRREGRISAVLTLEEGEICGGRLETLEEFYEAGVRMMTFTWNYENSLANGGGLTDLGIAFLERMESLGIIPDVSHLTDAAFYDVCRFGKKPFAASHSNSRALCGHKRNLTDDMIRKIADRGGVIGVNYYGCFLDNGLPEDGVYFGSVKRIAEHIWHMIQTGGLFCVGLGSDYDGFSGICEMEDCSRLSLLGDELKKKGLSERELEYVFYKNVLRMYQECW